MVCSAPPVYAQRVRSCESKGLKGLGRRAHGLGLTVWGLACMAFVCSGGFRVSH